MFVSQCAVALSVSEHVSVTSTVVWNLESVLCSHSTLPPAPLAIAAVVVLPVGRKWDARQLEVNSRRLVVGKAVYCDFF